MKRIIGTSALKNGLFKRDRFFISLILLVGIGILIGTFAVSLNKQAPESILTSIWKAYIEQRETSSIAKCFFGTFFSAFLVLALSYALGVCAVGTPFLYLVVVLDSVGKGTVLAFLYFEFGVFGFFKALLFLVLQNAVMCVLILNAVEISIKMSRQTFCLISGFDFCGKTVTYKKYNQRYLIILVLSIAVCLYDAVMSRFTYLFTK